MITETDGLVKSASQLLEEVHSKWQGLPPDHPCKRTGYAVFYSPVSFQPDFMLIGDNPGGDESSFLGEKVGEIPSRHEYFHEDYPLANRMRDIFSRADLTGLLGRSVKTNRIFFRTSNLDGWAKTDTTVRLDLESFCRSNLVEMVRLIQPKIILFESIGAFEALKTELRGSAREQVITTVSRPVGAGLGWLYHALRIKNHQHLKGFVALTHPSGSRPPISPDEVELISTLLKRDYSMLMK